MTRVARLAVVVIVALSACTAGTTGGPSDAGHDGTDAALPAVDAGADDAGMPGDDGGWQWPVPTMPITITPDPSWKNTITPDDAFIVGPRFDNPDQPRWVKFSVLMHDPTKVYFQDSRAYAFHFDFASAHLDPFVGLQRAAFDAVSLHELGQEVILGAVVFPPAFDVEEFGIQLIRQDAFEPEMARYLVELVRSAVIASPATQSFYMPTFEQLPGAQANEAFFTAHGIPLSSPERWSNGNGCYSAGWALGRLVQFPSTDIDSAYVSGALLPTDILVTDGVPAEIPYVAGVLSLTVSTPNSHVSILSQSYGVPFAYLKDEALRSSVTTLLNREVVVRVRTTYGCQIDVIDVEGTLSPAQRTGILDVRATPDIDLPALTMVGAISANADSLTPADITHFGGKASNYGILRTSIPEHSRPAVALSFDLFTAFLDQPLSTGGTLRGAIQQRLGAYTYPPDLRTLPTDLAAVQTLIKNAAFNEAQKAAILSALNSFAPETRLRFRSSTNVEDSDVFTGAGLYESFSGCIQDDVDSDTSGPSHCDPSESGERSVFRAIQRVYASFYNQNAFLERLRHHVDESRAAMGVLVHRTFLDEDELANGVATITLDASSSAIRSVSQEGAVSITNPEGGATPEIVDVDVFSGTAYPRITQSSSLVVLGGTVMDYPADYEALASLIVQVGERWSVVTGDMKPFTLDLEYKKVRGEGLVVRQVRPVPLPSNIASLTPFLLPQTPRLCVFQGEAGDVFGNHRLKSIWSGTTEGAWLDDALMGSVFSALSTEIVDGAMRKTVTAVPGATFSRDMVGLHDAFDVSVTGNVGHTVLTTSLPQRMTPRDGPLVVLKDGTLLVETTWEHPVQTFDFEGMLASVTTEMVALQPCVHDVTPGPGDRPAHRSAMAARGLTVEIDFFHPPAPMGATAGYTAPLRAWDHTTISGLTTEPIVLRGYWSQTYRPQHHNFTEDFIFEPRLEEGMAQSVVDALAAQDIVALHVSVGEFASVHVQGVDGTWRAW